MNSIISRPYPTLEVSLHREIWNEMTNIKASSFWIFEVAPVFCLQNWEMCSWCFYDCVRKQNPSSLTIRGPLVLNVILLMHQKSWVTTWDVQNREKIGINYQPQLVICSRIETPSTVLTCINRILTPPVNPTNLGRRIPSWELTYPLKSQYWVDDFPNFPRWDMLVP